MMRYFLNVEESGALVLDLEGQEYPSLDQAKGAALEAAREIMSVRVRRGYRPNGSKVVITVVSGQTVLVIPFADALE